ncbi:kinase-like domain-containing protein [Syncephalis fuscata]|nr:kinase-like domain-containing protein [Syncephalis fuscata]
MSNSQKIAVLPRILNQVLRGVNYLHKAQLVHGDISTTNIRVTKPILGKPSVLITGFGHSKHITSDELTTIQVTAKYNMSPESILQIPCNLRKHDTWAIGATIFKTLYGKYPYQHFAEEAAKGQDSKQFMQTIYRIRDSGISLLPVITENGAKFKKLAPL